MRLKRGIAPTLVALSLCTSATSQVWAEDPPRPPTVPAFDATAIDASVDPCENFYQYACGRWHTDNPRPPEVSYWSRLYSQFSGRLKNYLRILIEHAAEEGPERTDRERTADEQKLGDYYSACMDLDGLEQRGSRPLQQELSLIDGMQSIAELPTILGTLARTFSIDPWEQGGIGLAVYVSSDPVEGGAASRLWVVPSSLGLPGREHYLEQDERSKDLHQAYREHVAQTLILLGETKPRANEYAQAILALETSMAEARLPYSVVHNDPFATSNPMTMDELQALTPSFLWIDYLRSYGLPTDHRVNVAEPAYLRFFEGLLSRVPLTTWKAYLRWQLVAERARVLPARFRQARFEFYGKALNGLKNPRERSRICINAVEHDLPEVLSRVFVAQVFRPEMRTKTVEIFAGIKAVMSRRIGTTDWMAPKTRLQGLEKLEAMRLRVSHPDEWLDDPRLVVRSDDAYGNVQRSSASRRRSKAYGLGNPLDINDWWQPPTWMGAYPDHNLNAIFFAAAYLLVAEEGMLDPATLYGFLGQVLAHELIHHFDPNGRGYDAQGRLRDWWTDVDGENFNQRAQCLVDHFSQLEFAPGIPVHGDVVISEQVAELSGMSIAWEAFQTATSNKAEAEVEVAGTTADQRFFLTIAQSWCTEASDEEWRSMSTTDGHAAGAPAVNGIMVHFQEFAVAFGCQAGQAMVKPAEEACKVW